MVAKIINIIYNQFRRHKMEDFDYEQNIVGIHLWQRGVIAIDKEGKTEKVVLDGTPVHHLEATIELIKYFNREISKNLYLPYEAGVEGARLGLMIFQSDGEWAFVYVPSEITQQQLNSIEKIITKKKTKELTIIYNGELQETYDACNFLETIKKYIESNETEKRNKQL